MTFILSTAMWRLVTGGREPSSAIRSCVAELPRARAHRQGRPDEVRAQWEAMEDEIADLVDHLKRKLAQIDPGIVDRLSLARFVRFVEANSTALY